MEQVQVQCGFEPGDARLPLEDAEPARAEIAALSLAGFQRLGIKWEKIGAATSREVSFVSKDRRCFACWFQGSGGATLFYAYTVFQDGAFVLTARGGGWHPLRAKTAVRVVLESASVEQVLERHAHEVAAMESSGRVVRAVWDQPARLDATRTYYANPDLLQSGSAGARVQKVSLIADLGILALFVVQLLTLGSSKVAANLTAAAACTLVLGHWFFLARAVREAGTGFPWAHGLGSLGFCAIVVWNAFG